MCHNPFGIIPQLRLVYYSKSVNVICHISRIKEKMIQIISIYAPKAFDKIEHICIDKTF